MKTLTEEEMNLPEKIVQDGVEAKELPDPEHEDKKIDKQKVWAEIKREFPGRRNRALRERIFKSAEKSGQVMTPAEKAAIEARYGHKVSSKP